MRLNNEDRFRKIFLYNEEPLIRFIINVKNQFNIFQQRQNRQQQVRILIHHSLWDFNLGLINFLKYLFLLNIISVILRHFLKKQVKITFYNTMYLGIFL